MLRIVSDSSFLEYGMSRFVSQLSGVTGNKNAGGVLNRSSIINIKSFWDTGKYKVTCH